MPFFKIFLAALYRTLLILLLHNFWCIQIWYNGEKWVTFAFLLRVGLKTGILLSLDILMISCYI